jgi:acyl carrier protein
LTEAEIARKLMGFVEDKYFVAFDAGEIDPSTDLFAAGVFDSMALVGLTQYVETEFGVAVDPEAIMNGDLVSIESTTAYILKQSQAA